MEPKPIITIGPSKRAWSGPLSVEGMGAFTSVTPEQEVTRITPPAGEARNQGREIGPALERASGADQPTGAIERARLELIPKQPVALVRPGQPQRAGLLAGEPEPRVIGRVAHQQHGAMAATFGLAQRVVHQRRADAALAAVGHNRERAEQQRRPVGTGRHLPQPQRTDDAAALGGHQRQFRQTPFAQALGRLAEPGRPVGEVEQRLTRRSLGRPFLADGNHLRSPSAR
jgi:hypothetical protein